MQEQFLESKGVFNKEREKKSLEGKMSWVERARCWFI